MVSKTAGGAGPIKREGLYRSETLPVSREEGLDRVGKKLCGRQRWAVLGRA